MDIKTLDSLAERIATVRSQRVALEEKVSNAKAAFDEKVAPHIQTLKLMDSQEEELRQEMAKALKEAKKDSWQTEKVSVSRQQSTTFKVVNQSDTIAFLDSIGMKHEYVEEVVKKEAKGVFEQRFQKGETTPGVAAETKEFVRVVDRKPKAERGE